MEAIDKLDQWHKTRTGLLVFGLIELGLAYGAFCLSVNLGNFLLYFITAGLFIGGVKNIIKSLIGVYRSVRH
jgi:hypothetical protein